jgi:hypothetical protein
VKANALISGVLLRRSLESKTAVSGSADVPKTEPDTRVRWTEQEVREHPLTTEVKGAVSARSIRYRADTRG